MSQKVSMDSDLADVKKENSLAKDNNSFASRMFNWI